MIFKRVFDEISNNQERRKEGKLNCIPWLDMPKLSTVIPGIQKKRFYLVTAAPKCGKSQICDYLFMYQPYKFIQSEEVKDIKLKIFYFSLEISKEQKIKEVIGNKLYEYGVTISPENMDSQFKDYILKDEIKERIEALEPYIEEFEKTVVFIDNIRNSFGIYKTIRDYAELNGSYYDKNNQVIPMSEIQSNREKYAFINDHYIPNNPQEYVLVIIDHLSLLSPQKDEGTTFEAMKNFSNNHCMKMRDTFGYTPIVVQQQVASGEELKYSQGKLLIDSLRPSVDALADCKYTSKDLDYMLGLFAPYRFKLPKYPIPDGYNISLMQDRYRELSVILNRHGSGFINLDLGFNGACRIFKELEKPELINYSNLNF